MTIGESGIGQNDKNIFFRDELGCNYNTKGMRKHEVHYRSAETTKIFSRFQKIWHGFCIGIYINQLLTLKNSMHEFICAIVRHER